VSTWPYELPYVPPASVVGATVTVGALTVTVTVAGEDVPVPLVAVYVKLSEPKNPVVGV